jgi:hypothetical protein
MAHGTPDYGLTAGAQTTFQLNDLAELAVRLGSIVSYDRLGEVVFLDGFEQSIPRYALQCDGLGCSADYSAAHARNGLRSIHLVAGSDGDTDAALNFASVDIPPSRVGVQCSFIGVTNLSVLTMNVFAALLDGSWHAALSIHPLSQVLTIDDDTGAPLTIDAATPVSQDLLAWNTWKLVVDLVHHTYIRARFNGNSYDLTGIPLQSVGGPGRGQITLEVHLVGEVGLNDDAYIDDLILTQNEPG